jgi:hypothetical protein
LRSIFFCSVFFLFGLLIAQSGSLNFFNQIQTIGQNNVRLDSISSEMYPFGGYIDPKVGVGYARLFIISRVYHDLWYTVSPE